MNMSSSVTEMKRSIFRNINHAFQLFHMIKVWNNDIIKVIIIEAVSGMKWSEVRELYPNQFVKLKVLSSHIENGQEFIEGIAVIKSVSNESATKELLKSKGDELVYHTANEDIVLVVRQDVGLRRFDYHENQA